jgi:mono/diheme cytochrome c family protein
MSQQTRSEEASPIIPIIVFLIVVGGVLWLLLPRAPQQTTQASADTTEVAAAPSSETAATAAPLEPTGVPPTAVAQAEATEAVPTESTETAVIPEAFDPAAAYAWACAACHGADGRGVEGFGPSLLFSSDVMSRNIRSIVELLTVAQPPADPARGFVHPYRGGYPELTDEQLNELADYLFTLASG